MKRVLWVLDIPAGMLPGLLLVSVFAGAWCDWWICK